MAAWRVFDAECGAVQYPAGTNDAQGQRAAVLGDGHVDGWL
jgi:hypothetical protein